MSTLSRNEFGRFVLRSRLLDRELLERRFKELLDDPRYPDHSAEAFARFLVVSGDLTRYQAERLLGGRTEGFFFGGCKILDSLGAGGMGKVYLAEQVKLSRKVALKILPQDHAEDPHYVARFQREARAVAALKHPNIVQVYDVGQEGDTHYIIMELVEGTNLQQRIKRSGPFSVEESVGIIEQVARGLQHAHEHGIVHRDIKPSNLAAEGDTVKILDLGLARKFESGEALTRDGHGFGTPDYMAPEQFHDAHSADIRSDIYSLGCTWYCLLAGQPPFAGEEGLAKALAHVQKTPEPIQSLVATVPTGIANMIEKMMAKQAAERYQTPGELLIDIQRWQTPSAESRAMAATVTWQPPDSQRDRPRNGSEETPRVALAAATTDGSETLVRRPTTSVPTLLLYLVPVMAALVLGGVYLGITSLRKQLSEAQPIVIDVPISATDREEMPSKQSSNTGPATEQDQSPDMKESLARKTDQPRTDQPTENEPPANVAIARDTQPESNKPEPDAINRPTTPVPPEALSSQESPPARETRSPKSWRVGTMEGGLPDLESALAQAGDGDRIELAQSRPLEVGSLKIQGKQLTLEAIGRPATARARPILLWSQPPKPQVGQGLCQIERGGLTLIGIDCYIDLIGRAAADTDLVLFDLIEANFQLIDSTITVVSGAVENMSAVTAVRVRGEHPWDPMAKGEAPQPIRLRISNSMIRGSRTPIYLDSRQATVALENSIICGPDTVVHVFHTRPLEFAHHQLSLEIGACTLDTEGSLVRVDCRPFDLRPVRLEVKVRSTIVASSSAGASRPPQLLWDSPVRDQTLSPALQWVGENNCYFQRGEGLRARSPSGQLLTFVQSPADWQRVSLGNETSWLAPTTGVGLAAGPWHGRSPNAYTFNRSQAGPGPRSGSAAPRVGADIKHVANPRKLQGR